MISRTPKKRTARARIGTSDFLPIWNRDHTNAVHLLFCSVMGRWGVTDWRSYALVLGAPIALCIGVGGVLGAAQLGIKGALLGAIAGIAGPVALVYLLLIVTYAAALFLVFYAMWALIFWMVFCVLLS